MHPLAALWPVSISDELEQALATGERRVQRWVEMQGMTAVDFDPIRIFFASLVSAGCAVLIAVAVYVLFF